MSVHKREARYHGIGDQIYAAYRIHATRALSNNVRNIGPVDAFDQNGVGDHNAIRKVPTRHGAPACVVDPVADQHGIANAGHIHGSLDIGGGIEPCHERWVVQTIDGGIVRVGATVIPAPEKQCDHTNTSRDVS